MIDATISWLGCAVWRVWAAFAQQSPAEPAPAERALHVAASSPIRPRIGNATSSRPRAASPLPEEHDPVAPTI
jgi:hypothetical protein